jgi:hypothetical protein
MVAASVSVWHTGHEHEKNPSAVHLSQLVFGARIEGVVNSVSQEGHRQHQQCQR